MFSVYATRVVIAQWPVWHQSSKGVRWLKCKSKDQRISLLETILQSEWFLLKRSLLKPSTELSIVERF